MRPRLGACPRGGHCFLLTAAGAGGPRGGQPAVAVVMNRVIDPKKGRVAR
jgi:hypothetical protein